MEKVRISLRFTAAQQASLSAEAELRESSVALQSLEVSFLSMNIAYFSGSQHQLNIMKFLNVQVYSFLAVMQHVNMGIDKKTSGYSG